jgi:hypothetical protein
VTTKAKVCIGLILLAAATVAFAQQHFHNWIKVGETQGVNAFGAPVVICHWECRDYVSGYSHSATTSGQSFCPMPY